MQIEQIATSLLKEYEGNVKKHPKSQVEKIAQSIQQFGMNQPIAIDENNMIIAGHGRFMACLSLGMETVPCIRLGHMTEQQKKAYILTDNKLNMDTGFDMKALEKELATITDFKMDDFGFDLDFEVPDYKEITFEKTYAFENFEKADMLGDGKYDMPLLQPVTKLPEVTEWQGFNYVLSDKHPQGKGVHFFTHDYQFMRCWNTPDKYIEPLKRYKAVLTPDFSLYDDMPLAMCIYNHYRKQWLGAYWQQHGINVIPTVTWSNERHLDFCFDGIPVGGIVAVSTVGIMSRGDERFVEATKTGWDMMIDRLHPKKILLYGKPIEGLKGDIVNVESFTQRRWKDDGDG